MELMEFNTFMHFLCVHTVLCLQDQEFNVDLLYSLGWFSILKTSPQLNKMFFKTKKLN